MPSWSDSAVGDLLAHAGLEDVLGVVVGHGQQRGPVDQADEPGQPQEGPLGAGMPASSRTARVRCQTLPNSTCASVTCGQPRFVWLG